MNDKLKEVFRGKVVNKAHTINTGVDEFPRYVLEYLISLRRAIISSYAFRFTW
jgi:predicted ATP-dependent Lon-type protease